MSKYLFGAYCINNNGACKLSSISILYLEFGVLGRFCLVCVVVMMSSDISSLSYDISNLSCLVIR